MGVQFEHEFDLRRLAPGKDAQLRRQAAPQAYTNLSYADGAADKKALTAGDLRYGRAAASRPRSRGPA